MALGLPIEVVPSHLNGRFRDMRNIRTLGDMERVRASQLRSMYRYLPKWMAAADNSATIG